MRWSERQRTMLQAMGLRLWVPPEAPSAEGREPAVAVLERGGPAAPRTVAPTEPGAPPAAVPMSRASHPTAEPAVPTSQPGPAAVAARPLAVAPRPEEPIDADERRRAIAAMGWPALREAVAGCRACALCESRRHTVFGVGHERAHWMIVGEAPGENEDLQGEPFVGRAGQLLDAMLAALGLTRSERLPGRDHGVERPATAAERVFIVNTLKCRPPGNRNPSAPELAACTPYLERQIELVQPRVILAVGKFAIQSLLRSSEPVGRLRGRVHRWRDIPVIVSYHPAYLLRSPAEKARAWDDLCLAAETLAAGTTTFETAAGAPP